MRQPSPGATLPHKIKDRLEESLSYYNAAASPNLLPSGSSFSKIFHSLLSQREGRFPECLAALLQRQGRAGADHEAQRASCALPELLEWGRPGLRIRRRDLEVAQGSRRAKAGRSEDQPRLIARWALLRQRNQRHFGTRRLPGWHATCHRGAGRGLCGRSSQRQNAAHHDHAGTRKPLTVCSGDRLQLKANALATHGQRLANGEIVTVSAVLQDGSIRLDDGRTLPPSYRQFQRGYAVTSYGSQGKTVDHLLFADAAVRAATNAQQWYVTISRARKSVQVFTTDKDELRQAISRSGERELALDLAKSPRRSLRLRERFRRTLSRSRISSAFVSGSNARVDLDSHQTRNATPQ